MKVVTSITSSGYWLELFTTFIISFIITYYTALYIYICFKLLSSSADASTSEFHCRQLNCHLCKNSNSNVSNWDDWGGWV